MADPMNAALQAAQKTYSESPPDAQGRRRYSYVSPWSGETVDGWINADGSKEFTPETQARLAGYAQGAQAPKKGPQPTGELRSHEPTPRRQIEAAIKGDNPSAIRNVLAETAGQVADITGVSGMGEAGQMVRHGLQDGDAKQTGIGALQAALYLVSGGLGGIFAGRAAARAGDRAISNSLRSADDIAAGYMRTRIPVGYDPVAASALSAGRRAEADQAMAGLNSLADNGALRPSLAGGVTGAAVGGGHNAIDQHRHGRQPLSMDGIKEMLLAAGLGGAGGAAAGARMAQPSRAAEIASAQARAQPYRDAIALTEARANSDIARRAMMTDARDKANTIYAEQAARETVDSTNESVNRARGWADARRSRQASNATPEAPEPPPAGPDQPGATGPRPPQEAANPGRMDVPPPTGQRPHSEGQAPGEVLPPPTPDLPQANANESASRHHVLELTPPRDGGPPVNSLADPPPVVPMPTVRDGQLSMFPNGKQGRRDAVRGLVQRDAEAGYGPSAMTGQELVADLQRAGAKMPGKTQKGVLKKADATMEDFAAQVRGDLTPAAIRGAINRAMESKNFSVAPAALTFDEAMRGYRRMVIDMDGDGRPDGVVSVPEAPTPKNSLAGAP